MGETILYNSNADLQQVQALCQLCIGSTRVRTSPSQTSSDTFYGIYVGGAAYSDDEQFVSAIQQLIQTNLQTYSQRPLNMPIGIFYNGSQRLGVVTVYDEGITCRITDATYHKDDEEQQQTRHQENQFLAKLFRQACIAAGQTSLQPPLQVIGDCGITDGKHSAAIDAALPLPYHLFKISQLIMRESFYHNGVTMLPDAASPDELVEMYQVTASRGTERVFTITGDSIQDGDHDSVYYFNSTSEKIHTDSYHKDGDGTIHVIGHHDNSTLHASAYTAYDGINLFTLTFTRYPGEPAETYMFPAAWSLFLQKCEQQHIAEHDRGNPNKVLQQSVIVRFEREQLQLFKHGEYELLKKYLFMFGVLKIDNDINPIFKEKEQREAASLRAPTTVEITTPQVAQDQAQYIAELEEQLLTLRAENAELQEQDTVKDTQIQQLLQEIAALTERLAQTDGLSRQVQDLKDELEVKNEQLERLQQRDQRQTDVIESQQDQLRLREAEHEHELELEQTLAQHEETLTEKDLQLATAQEEATISVQVVQEKLAIINSLRTELQEQRTAYELNIAELGAQFESLDARFQQNINDRSDDRKQFDAEKSRMLAEIERLERTLEVQQIDATPTQLLEAQVLDLQQQLEAQEQAMDTQSQRYDLKATEVNTIRSEAQLLTEQLARVRESNGDIQRELDTSVIELEALRSALQSPAADDRDRQEELDELREANNALSQQLEKLLRSEKALKSKLENKTSQLSGATEELAELRPQYDTLQRQFDELHHTMAQMEKELTSLRSERRDYEKLLTAQSDRSRRNSSELTTEIERLSTLLAAQQDESVGQTQSRDDALEGLQTQLDTLEAQALAREGKFSRASVQASSAQETIHRLQVRIGELQGLKGFKKLQHGKIMDILGRLRNPHAGSIVIGGEARPLSYQFGCGMKARLKQSKDAQLTPILHRVALILYGTGAQQGLYKKAKDLSSVLHNPAEAKKFCAELMASENQTLLNTKLAGEHISHELVHNKTTQVSIATVNELCQYLFAFTLSDEFFHEMIDGVNRVTLSDDTFAHTDFVATTDYYEQQQAACARNL